MNDLSSKHNYSDQNDQQYTSNTDYQCKHHWRNVDDDSSSGSYSDTDGSIIEWESEIKPSGELLYIESPEEEFYRVENVNEKEKYDLTELIRNRSIKAGKFMKFMRRKDSKRWSKRRKNTNNCSKKNIQQIVQYEKLHRVLARVNPQRNCKLGRRATLCETYLGIVPGTFKDNTRVKIIGFIKDTTQNENLKVGDWLKSINGENVTSQNVESILSALITPTEITLELLRETNIKSLGPSESNPKQSKLVREILNEDQSKGLMDKLLDHSISVIYLKTMQSDDVETEIPTIIYTYPRSELTNIHSILCLAKGAFITLNHMLPEITGSKPISTTIKVAGERVHIVYESCNDELFLMALPERCCSLREAIKFTKDIVRSLEFTYQSLKQSFNRPENHTNLDHLFSLIFQQIISKDNENYKFESSFSVARAIQLPRDAQIQIDAALNEMEAMDYRDWNEDPMDCQRLFTILGSCIYHKSYLLGCHLADKDLIEVHSFLRQNKIFYLVEKESVKSLVLWKRIYPSSCNRGTDNGNQNDKWFLLVVGYGQDLLAVILESAGCTAKFDDRQGPDVFYVEEVQETLKHIQQVGVTGLAEKWITSNTRPEIINYASTTHAVKTVSSITDNLLGLIKSTDGQNHSSKCATTLSGSKKNLDFGTNVLKQSSSTITFGSGYSLHNSEDSLSQSTGAVSEISDEIAPILGRRAIREKNQQSKYLEDSDSDEVSKNHQQTTIHATLLDPTICAMPKKLTAGNENYLFYFVHLDTREGIILCSKQNKTSIQDENILINFNKSVHIIQELLHNTVKFKNMKNQDINKSVIDKSLIAIKEHGVLFHVEHVTYWVVGRLYTTPHLKELYVCYQDAAPQNLIEIAFRLI